jgi:hypothetical protein
MNARKCNKKKNRVSQFDLTLEGLSNSDAMEKIKKALEKAEEKTQKAVGGGGGGGGGGGHAKDVAKDVHCDALDADFRARTELFKKNSASARSLVLRIQTFARHVKESAVSASNLSTEFEAFRGAALAWVSLNGFGEKLEALVGEMATLEKLDLAPVAAQVEKANKRAKHVEQLKKKNDANALSEENAAKAELEELRTALGAANAKFDAVLRKTSSAFSELCIASTAALAQGCRKNTKRAFILN